MPVVPVQKDRPLNFSDSYTLGIGAGNATDLILSVAGITDLSILVENTHASAQMTVSIAWAMNQAGHGASGVYIDALGSSPTINAGVSDNWRFGSRFPTYTTDVVVDPYFSDVLPCNFIRIRMYGTAAASEATVWIQGHRQRL